MRQPVLTGGGWEGQGGRCGGVDKGTREPPPPAPKHAGASRPHLEFIAAAAGKGRRGGRGEWGAEAAPLPAPPPALPAYRVLSPGTQPSPAGSPSPSRGRPGGADAKAPLVRAGTRASQTRSDSPMAPAGH